MTFTYPDRFVHKPIIFRRGQLNLLRSIAYSKVFDGLCKPEFNYHSNLFSLFGSGYGIFRKASAEFQVVGVSKGLGELGAEVDNKVD